MINTPMKLAVIGLGYVGLPVAVEFGRQYEVIGYDISERRIVDLLNYHDRNFECFHDEIRSAVGLKFTSDINDLRDANIYIITVPTPIDMHRKPDLGPLREASKLVGSVLKIGDIVILESTVFPGATEEVCVPILEEHSGLLYGTDFTCGYSPERINPGDRSRTMRNITKVVSGSDSNTASIIYDLYASIIPAGVHLASSIKVAEAAKVIENSQRDLNIALMNELSNIFNLMGIDTYEVLAAAGTKWNFLPFKPGLVGGHCIGVDPYYLAHKAEEYGYSPRVILAGRAINDGMARNTAVRITKKLSNSGVDLSRAKVGILGVTFKENCSDIRNSKVFDMIDEFKSWGLEVCITDPFADTQLIKNDYNMDLVEISKLQGLDCLVIAVSHDEYLKLPHKQFYKMFKPNQDVILADLKNTLSGWSISDKHVEILKL